MLATIRILSHKSRACRSRLLLLDKVLLLSICPTFRCRSCTRHVDARRLTENLAPCSRRRRRQPPFRGSGRPALCTQVSASGLWGEEERPCSWSNLPVRAKIAPRDDGRCVVSLA